MINILVSVSVDLASSIAIRYAGQLGKLIEIALQPIHIKEPEQKGNLFGTGWVRHTWEHALAEKGQEEISLLIKTEKPYCPALAAPRVVVGERENEILRELQTGSYDLFMEGFLTSFDEGDFKRLVGSKLYQNVPCPIIVVKNLVPLDRIVLLTYNGVDPSRLVEQISGIFREAKLPVDVIHCVPEKGRDKIQVREQGNQEKELENVVDALKARNWESEKSEVITGRPRDIAEYLSKYGLVACVIRDGLDRKSPVYTVLAHTPSPIFIC